VRPPKTRCCLSPPPENRAEYSSGNSARLIDALQLLELTFIEPDPAALAALVDPDLLGVILFEIGAAPGTLVVMGFSLGLPALGVELEAHLVDYLEIALAEILFFVPARFLVDGHRAFHHLPENIHPALDGVR
jgi:hypothetical protein